MGLGAPKNRIKLSKDPNNLAWSNSTDGYGYRMLKKQGWKPGEYLGAQDASHTDHYTAANASHIRVQLREENLGLGAEVGGNSAETFGLSMFSGLLSRLNGKTEEEVQIEQKRQRNVQQKMYCVLKYGPMNFVRGGTLVGETIIPPQSDSIGTKSAAPTASANGLKALNAKKRKAPDGETGEARVSALEEIEPHGEGSDLLEVKESIDRAQVETPESKNVTKRRKKDHSTVLNTPRSPPRTDKLNSGLGERQKKRPKSKIGLAVEKANGLEDMSDAKLDPKLTKAERREDRRKRKDEKRARRMAKKQQSAPATGLPSTEPETSSLQSTSRAAVSAPNGRHALRQRYIQQKRMSCLDPQALKEIFMLNTASG